MSNQSEFVAYIGKPDDKGRTGAVLPCADAIRSLTYLHTMSLLLDQHYEARERGETQIEVQITLDEILEAVKESMPTRHLDLDWNSKSVAMIIRGTIDMAIGIFEDNYSLFPKSRQN